MKPELNDVSKDTLVKASCRDCDSYTLMLGYDPEPYIFSLCLRFTFEPSTNKVCEFFESELEVTND